jgi:hypothetical protein
MKKIDFTKLKIFWSFDEEAAGTSHDVNIAKPLANIMKYSGSVLLDIGWEELAKEIYYSKGPVEVPAEYIPSIIQVVTENGNIPAATKRAIIQSLK